MKSTKTLQETITTPDIGLSAYLNIFHGIADVSVQEEERIGSPRPVVVFHFPNTEKVNADAEHYWSGDARVEPQEYAKSIRECKKFVKEELVIYMRGK
jgi:hypothetical protein